MMSVLSLEDKIQRKMKDLPSPIKSETGYSKGIYHVSGKDHDQGKDCSNKDKSCSEMVHEFELRIVAVLTQQEEEISINNLDPPIRDLLATTNRTIRLCTFHLLKGLADDSLQDMAQKPDF